MYVYATQSDTISTVVHVFVYIPNIIGTARLLFKDVQVLQHSLVVREAIGESDADALRCVTDYRPCCNDTDKNRWLYAFGDPVGSAGSIFAFNDDRGVVRLYHRGSASFEGIFTCEIQTADDSTSTLYVGIYPTTPDEIGNPAMGNGESHHCISRLYGNG